MTEPQKQSDPALDAYDAHEQRCRLLGHPVPFSYCRAQPEGRPCRLVVECWQSHFDVNAWLNAHFTPEQIAWILAPPKPKMLSLVEMIEKAKRAAQE